MKNAETTVKVDRRREKIRALFNRIAPRYDAMNRIMTFGIDRVWRRHLVREAVSFLVRCGETPAFLDIATGTGDIALAVKRRLPQTRVTGIDISDAMLVFARAKMERDGMRQVIFKRASAETIGSSKAVFNAAAVAFGYRNVRDNDRALKAAASALKPNGRLYVLEFFKPDNLFTRIFQTVYVRCVIPVIARFVAGAASDYAYLGNSINDYDTIKAFIARAEKNGFSFFSRRRFMFGVADLVVIERKAGGRAQARSRTAR
ncbi:MAG: ubiquinone/menaquinone biosynthesis methyltransferase [Spirochaetes bacterium]|nr:ubiquinone/menaquinone biosynthesis methyltransferase [Spirochaetota bacterium]